MFRLIFFGIPVLTLLWLFWATWRMRKLGVRPHWRALLITSTSLVLGAYLWIICYRMDTVAIPAPSWMQALILLWGLVFLPLIALPMMTGWSILSAAKSCTRKFFPLPAPSEPHTEKPEAATAITRRQMLGTTALALPMLGTFGATAISIPQRNHFRVRDITVRIPGLPAALDGARIAHISDTHVGKFTNGKVLRELAETTNKLKADLVLLTGDLIDHSISDLPEALDMVGRLDPRSGLFMIEGNHDLFEGVAPFVDGVRSRGIPLLRNETSGVRVNGHPVELLGISWNRGEGRTAESVDAVADMRDPDALPILLAHHPHAFDRATERGIPLTLAGHTHGGQLMLTPGIGPGPMMFRYWSGLYQKPASSLVVSNGAGNWFPLRTAAPAEIVHIILRRV